MNIEELTHEIEKIKYHLEILTQTLDIDKHRFVLLILEMNWDKNHVEEIHNIFEKYSKQIEKGETVEWFKLKNDLETQMDISYPVFKQLVRALHHNDSWTDVCIEYVKSLEPSIPMGLKKVV